MGWSVINSFFVWIVCFVVFIPLGADIAVLIEYSGHTPNWYIKIITFLFTVIVMIGCGIKKGASND